MLYSMVTDPKESFLLQGMYAFTFGSLMGDVFLHIFPSIIGHYSENHIPYTYEEQIRINMYVVAGAVFCYFLEIIINTYLHPDHHTHPHHEDAGEHAKDVAKAKIEADKQASITLALFGDALHNFTDGVAVASTFALSPKLGILTSLACFVHEIPHEVGDFAYAFKNGYTYWQSLKSQLFTGCGALVGAIVSLVFSRENTIEMVAISGGTFIYMSFCLFLEDLRKAKSIVGAFINIGFICAGLYSMHLVGQFE